MKMFRVDWTNDRFEDYLCEKEWINAYPDNPCPGCGKPNTLKSAKCDNCGAVPVF